MKDECVKFLEFVPVEFYGFFKIFDVNCMFETMYLYGRLFRKFRGRAKHVQLPSRSGAAALAVLTSSLNELFIDNE